METKYMMRTRRFLKLVALIGSSYATVLAQQQYTISTYAGNGEVGTSGDGGPAVQAKLELISSPLAVDSAGNLYIGEGNFRVRKVSPNGIITTVAGIASQSGYAGDGGPATAALLGPAYGLATDRAANLYISDGVNHVVRKVATNGIITTFAGNGTIGYSGDGGPATAAQFSNLNGLATDSAGNLYIADLIRVRKVSPTGVITTVAGGALGYSGDGGPATSAAFNLIQALAMDGAGNLYIADEGNLVIRKVSPNGIVTTVAGNHMYGYSGDGAPAVKASIGPAWGVAVDPAGDLFIAVNDLWAYYLKISTPVDLGYASTSVSLTNRVLEVSPAGIISTAAGNGKSGYTGDGGPATQAEIGRSQTSVAIDAAGNIYFDDPVNRVIRRLTPTGPTTAAKPAITSVLNDASFTGGAIAAGSWVAIFGTNLAPPGDARQWTAPEIVNGNLPVSLDGTSVTVNGKPATVEYIQPTQINIQTPDDTAVGPVQVVVTTTAGTSASFTANYARFAPGLFQSTSPYLAAQHVDGSYVTPASPAKLGEIIVVWGTGFGPANPAVPSGKVVTAPSALGSNVTVTIGGQPAQVQFAGAVGVGLVQINVQVPHSINNGDAAVIATVGSVSTQSTANQLSVHN